MQGPHQGAQKSTTTGVEDLITCASNVLSNKINGFCPCGQLYPSGYNYVHFKSTGSVGPSGSLAIVYNAEYKLVSKIGGDFIAYSSKERRPWMVCLFENVHTRKRVLVVNLQMSHHNNTRPQEYDMIVGVVKKFNPDSYDRLVMCGDFNYEKPLEEIKKRLLSRLYESKFLKTCCLDKTSSRSTYNYGFDQTVSLLPTHHKSTNAVIARNRRIGVSISGITETIEKLGMTRIITILREGYQTVLKADNEFSTQAGIPTSVRHTTIKPSGSISQLVGVPSGMHFPTFRYAIRRMRVATNSKFCDTLKDSGVPHELEYYRIPLAQGQTEIPPDQYTLYGVHDSKNLEYIEYRGNLCAKITHPETTVFEFPVDLGQAREAKKVSAWEQFALLAMLQREWSDNLVSCTIYYNRDTESDQLEHMLASYAPIVKSVSVLPHTELGDYPQMPYEGINQETYQKLKDKLGSIDWSRFTGSEGMEPKFCTGETCELNL